MNINSRIDWTSGMNLTSGALTGLDETLAWKQQIAGRAFNGSHFGLIPYSEFKITGGFVKNKLELEHVSCMALLPSGKILHVDEAVTVAVPLLYGEEYFLTAAFGGNELRFEVKDVPYVRPEYVWAISTIDEIIGTDKFPVMKFKVSEGVFSIDESWLPPCLCLSSDGRFGQYLPTLQDLATQIAGHPHLVYPEAKLAFRRYAFRLQDVSPDARTADFLNSTMELARVVEFYIPQPEGSQPIEFPRCTVYDAAAWLDWLQDYMKNAILILDDTEPEDDSIDYEQLKADIKAELYAQLKPELYDVLKAELGESLRKEISEELRTKLTELINGSLKASLHGILSGELSNELFEKLYQKLYDDLYNALFVPLEKEEEEEFTPMI